MIFHCPTLLDPLDAVKCLNDGGDLLHVNHTIVVHVVQTEGKLQLIYVLVESLEHKVPLCRLLH